MHTFVDDIQVVTNVPGTLFSIIQQGNVNAGVTLKNLDGVTTVSYAFQEFNFAGTWANIGVSGTLVPGSSIAMQLTSNYPQVRLWGSTSGADANLAFSLSRLFDRQTDRIPLLL